MRLIDIIMARKALSQVTVPVDFELAYRIATFLKETELAAGMADGFRAQIFEKYAEGEGASRHIPKAKMAEANKELNKMGETEIEDIEPPRFSPADFAGVRMSAAAAAALLPLLKENDNE